MKIIPLTLKQANIFILDNHRHHKPVVGCRFCIAAVSKNRALIGVAIVGRPTARMTDQNFVAEVTRLCTDGSMNGCSFLYAACSRIAREMGFEKIQTFILESETGVSLKASGWVFDGWSAGGDWNRLSRGGRRTDQPQVRKQRWVKVFA